MDSVLSVQNKNFLRKTEKSLQKFLELPGSLKSFTLTIPWSLAKPVKTCPGIIVRLHHTDRRLMALLREQYAELKKGPQLCCCNQVWMKNGGRSPWNVTAICEMFKISCLMRKHLTKDDLESFSKDR